MAGPFLVAHNRVVIDAPAQRVFDYLADLSRIVEWSGESDFSITSVPTAPPRAGAQIRWEKSGVMHGPIILRGGMGESRVSLVKITRIAEYQPNSGLVIETRNSYNGLLHSIEKFSFDLHEQEGRTTVTLLAEVEAMVPACSWDRCTPYDWSVGPSSVCWETGWVGCSPEPRWEATWRSSRKRPRLRRSPGPTELHSLPARYPAIAPPAVSRPRRGGLPQRPVPACAIAAAR